MSVHGVLSLPELDGPDDLPVRLEHEHRSVVDELSLYRIDADRTPPSLDLRFPKDGGEPLGIFMPA